MSGEVQTVYEVRERVNVAAPPERVWQALTAWDRQSEWVLATRTYATDLAGQGLGGGLSARTGLGPFGFTDTMVITEWAPPRVCRVRHTGRLVRGTGCFEVDPHGTGALVTWSEQLILPFGRLGESLWPLIESMTSWALRRSLRRFASWAPAYPR